MYALVLFCAVMMAIMVLRYDLHGREPWYMVVLALMLGAGVMSGVGTAENFVLARLRWTPDFIVAKALLISILEESAKAAVVVFVARAFRRHFRTLLDGLIYGTLCGLGMGIDESLMYLGLSPASAQTLGAEVIRLFAHSMMGGLIGFGVGLWTLGWTRPGRPATRRHVRAGLLAAGSMLTALMVHFSWDYVAYQPRTGLVLRGFLMLLMLALMMLWGAMVAFAMDEQKDVPGLGRAGVFGDRRRGFEPV